MTERAAWKLEGFLQPLYETENDALLTADQAASLRAIMNEVRPTLFAEAEGNVAYIVADKRLDVNKLLDDVGSLFGSGVFSSMNAIARLDFEEAGKCLAFERATAAAFHLMRGTESVLRDFYFSVVKQKRLKKPMWGGILDQLEARRTPPPAALLATLRSIKDNFRNPTQHPDKVYDLDEVQDLFGLSVDVVNRMTRLMKEE